MNLCLFNNGFCHSVWIGENCTSFKKKICILHNWFYCCMSGMIIMFLKVKFLSDFFALRLKLEWSFMLCLGGNHNNIWKILYNFSIMLWNMQYAIIEYSKAIFVLSVLHTFNLKSQSYASHVMVLDICFYFIFFGKKVMNPSPMRYPRSFFMIDILIIIFPRL